VRLSNLHLALSARRSGSGYSPAALFAAGEQGGWYDPSDLTTMFQDSAGTTPVTAVEQPVGLWLDKRLGALSALGANKFVGWTTGTGLWVDNGNGSWSITNAAAQTDLRADFSGPNNVVHEITFTASGWSGVIVCFPLNGVPFQVVTNGPQVSVSVRNASFLIIRASAGATLTVSNISVREVPGNHLIQPTSASRPTYSKRYNLLLATATLATQSVTVAAGSYTLSFAGAGSITLSGTGSGTFSAGTHTITTTAGSLTLTVSGAVTSADLRRTIHTQMGMPAYQRVTTATDYDETGFLPRLRFDGADDSMYSAASINFSATDEMTVIVGQTRLGSGGGMMIELTSGGASGSFYIFENSATQYQWRSGGSALVNVDSTSAFPSPRNNVLTGLGDISGDIATLRINGAQNATNAADQGTGNYANAGLFVGRRNNSSNPFNGDIFQLLIRGALTSGADLTSAEQYVAARTGVTL